MPQNGIFGPRYFLNRHFSWLQFNERVLEEAHDSEPPGSEFKL
jgi:polyphosphate kinase